MSYVDFDGSSALQAKEIGEIREEKFLSNHCPNVADGIGGLIEWIKFAQILSDSINCPIKR